MKIRWIIVIAVAGLLFAGNVVQGAEDEGDWAKDQPKRERAPDELGDRPGKGGKEERQIEKRKDKEIKKDKVAKQEKRANPQKRSKEFRRDRPDSPEARWSRRMGPPEGGPPFGPRGFGGAGPQGPEGELQQRHMRQHHLSVAVQHLRMAGMPDLAQRIERQLAQGGERPGMGFGRPGLEREGNPREALQDLRRELEQLRAEIRELRQQR